MGVLVVTGVGLYLFWRVRGVVRLLAISLFFAFALFPVPLVYGRSVKVNPLVTIVSLLVGAALFGILGVLLAIPTAAAIQIILRDWWSARAVTGDRSEGGGEDGTATAESPKASDVSSPTEARR